MKKLLDAAAACVAQVCLVSICSAATIHIETNGSDENDGSQGNPVLTLARAVALAQEDDTILFGDGEFEEPAVQVTIDKNLTITSKNGPDQTTFRSLHTGATGNVADHSGWLYLTNCPQTVVSGIYFCGKKKDGTQPKIRTAVYMREDAGTVSNCVFRYLQGGVGYGNNQVGMGPAAYMQGGTVVDCLFEENYTDRFYPKGGAVVVGGQNCRGTPLVDRCKFIRNWGAKVAGNNSSLGGAMYISNGATVRNSLFYGNHSDNGLEGAIGYRYLENNFKIINCTAVSNSCSAANQTSDRTWPQGYFLCDSIAWGNYSAGVVETTPDPGFVDAAGGDFHLAAGSTAIDTSSPTYVFSKKTYEIDPLRGDCDLDGNPRVMGARADKGCYEFDPNQFSLGIDCKKLDTFAPARVQFWASAIGGEMDDEQSYWTFDGTEPTADHHDAAGTNVTVTLSAGTYTVRFATVAAGMLHSVEKANMVSLISQQVFVKKGNPTAQAPYDTWEKAAAEFSDVQNLPLVANQIVTIDDGTYPIRSSLIAPAGLVIRSVNGPEKTVLDATSGGNPVITISSAGAVISGIKIWNRLDTEDYAVAGLSMTAEATVTNCIFDTCSSLGSNPAALSASKGLVVDCVFTNIYRKTGEAGIVMNITGTALADRCRVSDSHFFGKTYANETAYGAIYVAGGTVRNTLVEGTRYGGCVGIYVGANGKVENCTVASNQTLTATEISRGLYVGAASGSVTNTIAALNVDANGAAANAGGIDGWEASVGSSFLGGDPLFKNPARWNFNLRQSSPCVNAGAVLPWMDGAKDLDGNPRMTRDGTVDIGCYQASRNGLILLVY